MSKEFIGKDYETEKEKEIILSKYDKFQRAKIEYLNFMYDNELTLINMWSLYNSHIHDKEVLLGKDIVFFTNKEIKDLIYSKFNYGKKTKGSIMSMISNIKEWARERGDIIVNDVNGINRNDLTASKPVILNNYLMGMVEFYKFLDFAETKSCTINDLVPLLLARYSIAGVNLKHMINLKWKDIDYENKTVTIYLEKKDVIIPRKIFVDDLFLNTVDLIKEDITNEDDYVLSKNNGQYSKSGLRTKTFVVAKNTEKPRISYNNLVKSRQLDYLLAIRRERCLSILDFKRVYNMCIGVVIKTPTCYAPAYDLKTWWEELTGDKVLDTIFTKKNRNDSGLYEPNGRSLSVANSIMEKLNYTIPDDIRMDILLSEEDDEQLF